MILNRLRNTARLIAKVRTENIEDRAVELMVFHVDPRTRFTLLALLALLAPADRPGLSTARHCAEWIAPAFCRTRVEHPLDLGSRQGHTGSRRTGPDIDFSLFLILPR